MTAKPKGTEVAVVVDENSSEKPQQTAANQFIFEIPEENSTYIWYPLCHCSEPFFAVQIYASHLEALHSPTAHLSEAILEFYIWCDTHEHIVIHLAKAYPY